MQRFERCDDRSIRSGGAKVNGALTHKKYAGSKSYSPVKL